MKRVHVGNGCGFWGDSIDAPVKLAESGQLDYLTLEYLAELTMSILALQKQRDRTSGYAADWLDVLERLCPVVGKQPGLTIVTNAGGVNPRVCGERSLERISRHGISGKVAVVTGDDVMPKLDELIATGHTLNHLDTGESIESIRDRVVSANAYLGAKPIAEALDLGAKIVVTGRVADAALTLGPLAHEFGWMWDDWDRLASGVLAGHLIECGAQVTGGVWVGADESTRLAAVGYPVVEVAGDGSMVLTKPTDTGGVVSVETVAEQLLYEVDDPARYLTPDVVANFTTPTVAEVARDRVAVSPASGSAATDKYKLSVAYRSGYMSAGTLVVSGPNAVAKARWSGQVLLDRLRGSDLTFDESLIEVLGAGDSVPGVLPAAEPPEVVLRVAVRDRRRGAVERFTKEFSPLVTSGFAGTTGYTTGRPGVREVLAYWPCLIVKQAVTPTVELLG